MKRIAVSMIGPLLLFATSAEAGSPMSGGRDLYLEVTVKDEVGAPVWRAEIILEGFPAWEGRPVYTQAEGWAVFTGLENGDYRIRVSAPHYASAVHADHLISSDNIGIVLRRESESGLRAGASSVSLADLAAPRKAEAEYKKGMAHLEKGRYEKGRQAFQAAVAAYPSYSAAYAGLGTSLLQLRRREEALQAFGRAVKLNDRSYDAQLSIGLILNDQKRFGEAYPHLVAAAALRSDHPWQLHYEMGRTYYGLNRLSEAEKSLQQARQARPRYGNLYLLLANTLTLEQKYEHAIPELEEFLRVAPESPVAGEVRSKLSLLRAEVERQRDEPVNGQ